MADVLLFGVGFGAGFCAGVAALAGWLCFRLARSLDTDSAETS